MVTAANPGQHETIRLLHAGETRNAGTQPGQSSRVATGYRWWFWLMCLVAVATIFPASANAQSFEPVPALSFSKTFGGDNPLPQVITIASTGAAFDFNATATATTGGTWLTITPNAFGCCSATPTTVTVTANPAVTLAAGTYTGQIVVKSNTGTISMTIPVSLKVHATTETYFDQVAGGLTFTMQTNGTVPPGQAISIRDAGAGSLAWTSSVSTSDGGAWLSIAAASGTAPSVATVSVNTTKLPGLGLTAGTFTGQVVLKTTADTITIPVTIKVGDSVFRQVNPVSFNKAYSGANPVSQVITVASTGSDFDFNAAVLSSTGGGWLTITPNSYGCCTATAQAITLTANPAVTLAAGTYMAEVIVRSNVGDEALSIPVTLTINPSTVPFFDDVAGALNYSMAAAGTAPPAQVLQIRNAGTGSLVWTAAATTADGGKWLAVSPASGTVTTSPATLTVAVIPANLPGQGLVPGTFVGQVALQTTTGPVTIPVSMVVGAGVFRQVNPLSFTKVFGGANPLPQVITVASTGADFDFNAVVANSTGGNWLTITPASYGCCTPTPQAITVTVNPVVTLAAGTYEAEIVVKSNAGSPSLTVPVTLTIQPATATFFDTLPGQLTFSMLTKGTNPPPQALEIRNAGTGTLSWIATTSTADGGAWLTISPASGIAPSAPNVVVTASKLPGGGLIAGTFTGQVALLNGVNRVTIPVTMVVGDSVFRQVNGLDFNKVFGGPNPLPQLITVSSTGAAFDFNATAVSSTGGNWLVISPNSYGCCTATPQVLTVSVNPAVTLAAGTYTSEIIVKSNAGSPSMIVPVSLTINPATAAFFDDMPGGISFFQATAGTAPAAQTIRIRNAGMGTLNWTAAVSTSDGGAWLALSTPSLTAPTNLTVAVKPASLPGGGLIAGTFNGTIILTTATDRQTIPVSFVVGANVFKPTLALTFAKTAGGSNPAAQVISVASTAAAFDFVGVASSATGGTWFTITPSSYGCCTATPLSVTVTPNPAVTLAAGSYVGQIIFRSTAGDQGLVVPVTLTITGTAATATPTFAPPGGSYSTTQSVTISDATRGAAIYYTLDGTTPTTASKQYSVPLSVTATETIKAIAVAPGFPQSALATAVYTITTPPAATPIATQTVTISEATTGATVYYTTNGTTPTTASTKYTQSAVRTVTVTIQ